jgi:hypothetical protein
MPAHQVDRLTGIGPFGARMPGSRTKPASGNSDCAGTFEFGNVVSTVNLKGCTPYECGRRGSADVI